jgi:hypothetical protein
MCILVDFTDTEQRIAFDKYTGDPSMSDDYTNEGITQLVFNRLSGELQTKVKRGIYFESINTEHTPENIKQLKKIKEII